MATNVEINYMKSDGSFEVLIPSGGGANVDRGSYTGTGSLNASFSTRIDFVIGVLADRNNNFIILPRVTNDSRYSPLSSFWQESSNGQLFINWYNRNISVINISGQSPIYSVNLQLMGIYQYQSPSNTNTSQAITLTYLPRGSNYEKAFNGSGYTYNYMFIG